MLSSTSTAFETDRTTSISVSASENGKQLSFQICRGRTQFPLRPISPHRFLIGSDENCDLRLGGDDIPLLHSLIHFDGESYHIDTLIAVPPLKINAQVVQSAVLHDGDHIEIGPFAFRVRESEQASQEAKHVDSLQPDGLDLPDMQLVNQKPHDLSAAELADLLDKELSGVDRFESRRRMGAATLLQAIASHADSLQEVASPARMTQPAEHTTADGTLPVLNQPEIEPSTQSKPIEDLADDGVLAQFEHVLKELNVFVDELERRSERLADREASYSDAAATLLDVQQELTTQLESLLEQRSLMGHREEEDAAFPRRASA